MKKSIFFIGALALAIGAFGVFSAFEDPNEAKVTEKYEELKKEFMAKQMEECMKSAEDVAMNMYNEEVEAMANGGEVKTSTPGRTTPRTTTGGGGSEATTTTNTTEPTKTEPATTTTKEPTTKGGAATTKTGTTTSGGKGGAAKDKTGGQ